MDRQNYLDRLMGTRFFVSIVSEDPQDLAYVRLRRLGLEYEQEFSRFIDKSALSILNKNKELRPSRRFLAVLAKAKDLYDETDGVFNPLVRLDVLGYDRDFSLVDEFEEKDEEVDLNFEKVQLSEGILRVGKRQKLDFGGFLKALVAQEMSNLLLDFPGSIVNIGGDIVTRGREFEFKIYNPISKKKDILVTLKDKAMATSGVYNRKWQGNEHIVGPKSDLVSVSVIGDIAYKCDAYATTCFVLGSEGGHKFLKDRGFDYVFVKSDGKVLKSF